MVKRSNDIDEDLITYDFIAKQFVQEVHAIHRRGLVKNYVVVKEPTSHLGGRVMMNDLMSYILLLDNRLSFAKKINIQGISC
ncbi:5-methylcytosine-specific restriction endonuclease McrBC regulatory subunit McrC [Neobacillus niacini]|nr:5-methylcytosine-specific restriction endonuclease McrBC regulatory subunit McrC [Neobacillus niacini]